MKLVAFYIADYRQWDRSNDMVAAMVAALVLEEDIRAHIDGVYRYSQGAFRFIEELDQKDMRSVEVALHNAAKMFRVMMKRNAEFSVASAFDSVRELAGTFAGMVLVTNKDYHMKKDEVYAGWAMDACKGTTSLTPRFTGRASPPQWSS